MTFKVYKDNCSAHFINTNKLRVYLITDIHIGSGHFARKFFLKTIQNIKEDANAVVIINGDMIENITPKSKIPESGQILTVNEQLDELKKMLKPIANKILFIRGGNHEDRTILAAGLDIILNFCKDLGVPYFPNTGVTDIKIKGREFSMVSGHGNSASDNEFTKLVSSYGDRDLYYLGHSHELSVRRKDSITTGTVDDYRYFVRGGSFLDYADYARKKGYPPTVLGYVIVEISKDGFTVEQVRKVEKLKIKSIIYEDFSL